MLLSILAEAFFSTVNSLQENSAYNNSSNNYSDNYSYNSDKESSLFSELDIGFGLMDDFGF